MMHGCWTFLQPSAAVSTEAGQSGQPRSGLPVSTAAGLAPAPNPAKKAGKDQAKLEGVLKDAVMGEVCTRFPPEASGFLHIGHAKALLLNHHYAKQYRGRMILRFDDTNPSKSKAEFEESILADIAKLDIVPDHISHTSDHFDMLQQKMTDLIQNGWAYCDQTEVGELRSQRLSGIESKYRNQSVEENLRLWGEMLAGSAEGLKTCVRGKGGKLHMQSLNKCLRDPVFYRCKPLVLHHRTGYYYNVYPTYDFACPILDAVEGVTHPMRTIEYRDRDPMYTWVQQTAGVRVLHITEFSKSQFMYTILSKRKLQEMVDTGAVDGWDDPRFPTIQGVTRHGMTVDALLEFCLTLGASKKTALMSWDKIWALNKQKIDPVAPRYAAIEDSDKVELVLQDGPAEPFRALRPKHPKNPALGERLLTFSKSVWLKRGDLELLRDGEEVTLMHWGNIFLDAVEKDGGKIVKATGRLNLGGDAKQTKWKLHWVANVETTTPVLLRRYDTVLTKEKMDDTDKLADCINWDSQKDSVATGDPMLSTLQKGAKLQLERTGYFIVDQVPEGGAPLVLVEIPDGKATTMVGDAKLEAGKPISTLNKKEQQKRKERKAAGCAALRAA